MKELQIERFVAPFFCANILRIYLRAFGAICGRDFVSLVCRIFFQLLIGKIL